MRGFLRRCLERGGLRGVLRGRRYRNGREVRNREDETLSLKHDKCSSESFKIIITKPTSEILLFQIKSVKSKVVQ